MRNSISTSPSIAFVMSTFCGHPSRALFELATISRSVVDCLGESFYPEGVLGTLRANRDNELQPFFQTLMLEKKGKGFVYQTLGEVTFGLLTVEGKNSRPLEENPVGLYVVALGYKRTGTVTESALKIWGKRDLKPKLKVFSSEQGKEECLQKLWGYMQKVAELEKIKLELAAAAKK